MSSKAGKEQRTRIFGGLSFWQFFLLYMHTSLHRNINAQTNHPLYNFNKRVKNNNEIWSCMEINEIHLLLSIFMSIYIGELYEVLIYRTHNSSKIASRACLLVSITQNINNISTCVFENPAIWYMLKWLILIKKYVFKC